LKTKNLDWVLLYKSTFFDARFPCLEMLERLVVKVFPVQSLQSEPGCSALDLENPECPAKPVQIFVTMAKTPLFNLTQESGHKSG